MLKYTISYQYPHRSFLDLELVIDDISTDTLELHLPNWRPGRYQIQNFAKNIRRFEVYSENGSPLPYRKTNKSIWQIQTQNTNKITVKYEYFARQVDAGGSCLTDNLLYINWITCAFYLKDRMNEPYEIKLEIPKNYQIACSLDQKNQILFAPNFYELVDAPLMASPNLKHQTYQCEGFDTTFHLWFEGNVSPNWEKIKTDFQEFTEIQLKLFQEFPASDYHFLFLILPIKQYHGVEHRNSTMIVMGKDSDFENFYHADILGISSHELFHFWNAIRIRPTELSPYNFDHENYFETGFVIEGLTTYYGDYLLFRSKVWSEADYFKELNQLFKRHFDNHGRFYKSVAESSTDLWLDGYELGIPNRKTSIYVKGAITAFMLDLKIRELTQNQKSLDNVMRLLWKNYGKSEIGYTCKNYIESVNLVAGTDLNDFFEKYIFGTEPLENPLRESLNFIGCELQKVPAKTKLEEIFGIQTLPNNGTIWRIATNSPADFALTVGDEILQINGQKFSSNFSFPENNLIKLNFTIKRIGQELNLELTPHEESYFPQFQIRKKVNMTESQQQNFEAWQTYI